MVKRVLRRLLRATKKWLDEESATARSEELVDETAFENEPFLYPLLGARLRRLMTSQACSSRPNYAWGILQGVSLAQATGIDRVSVLEFGVAGGKGLLALENIAERLEIIYNIPIDVYGFDTGTGLPKPLDYRDCPNLCSEGDYSTDKDKLLRRLRRARLFWGLVENSIPEFINSKPSPVAFIAFDLDLYSSTMQAFRLLEAPADLLLPRIHCYFDDILGFTWGDHNGERLAISDFNLSHEMRKISYIYGLKYYVPPAYVDERWLEKFYIAHIFDHPLYGQRDGLVRCPVLPIDE